MRSALVAMLALAMGVAHAAGKPLVRVEIEGKPPFLVGQQIKVNVTVFAPNFFMSAPELPALDIPGAVATVSEGTEQNVNETIDGESYAGIQQTYLIVAQQAGEFTLPPVKITFQYAAEPGKPPTDGAVALLPQTFTAALPAGAETAGGPAPVARVTITQTLDRDFKGLKVGDTLTRTVDVFAEGTQAMMIPPPTFEAPPEVRVYRQDPVLTDVTQDRVGFVGGRRIDRATYVFEKPGDYTLPAIETPWFSATAGQQEVARAPEIRVTVAPNPGFKPAIAPEGPSATSLPSPVTGFNGQRWLPWAISVLTAVVIIAWLLHRYGSRYSAWSDARRRAREVSEAAYFTRVEEACRANDPAGAYRALGDWVRRAGVVSIAAWCAEVGDPELRAEIPAIEQRLFAGRGQAGAWDGRILSSALGNARRAWLASRSSAAERLPALPALNP